MERFSPKIEIINTLTIDIDGCLEKYNDKEFICEILKSSEYNRRVFRNVSKNFKVEFFIKIDSSNQNLNQWPESTKVKDYLKQNRMKTIEELKKAQEETLEYYRLNLDRFKSKLNKEKNIEELKSELFAEKFYFQVNFKPPYLSQLLSKYLHSSLTFIYLNLISIH